MDFNLIIFTGLAIVMIVSALFAVTSSKIMRATTLLLFVLFGTAGIYFILHYTFLGAVQITVYAGGIVVLFIFAILLIGKGSVDVTQSQCLEIKPVSELGNACFTAEDDVLVTDAVYTFSVKSRLIGCNHSRKKRLRIILETDRLRTFVNAEVVSHSVTGSVAEVSAGTPQRHTRKGVELMAGSAARECCHRKIYHTLEN